MSVGAPPATPQAMSTPGSLTSLMDGLVLLQATVAEHPLLAADEPLATYRWRPDQADVPALYNWLLPSTAEMKDLSRIRDSISIVSRIAIRWTDVEDRMSYVERAADAYRATVDPSYWNRQAPSPELAAYATWAVRVSMNSFSEEIGGVTLVGIEFNQTYWLDRHIR